MTKDQAILQANLEACRQRIAKLQEDISDKSNRDRTLLMEKLGAIKSAEDFGTAALLRNKFSHHYPEESGARLERLNLVVEEARFVNATFDHITAYLERKQIHIR